MKYFVDSIEQSIAARNWYAALTAALSLPDICGYLNDPNEKSGSRYATWFDKYVKPLYMRPPLPTFDGMLALFNGLPDAFLSGNDCYALRCALLHQGSDEIGGQRVREVIDRFHFIEPPGNLMVHCNQVNNVLQLQVDVFCADIMAGVRAWLNDVQDNKDVQLRMRGLIRIHNLRLRF